MRATKDRIIDAAVTLFNRSSVSAVTTNHIAAHLGISPGNLYYHFKNKEEILRAAFDRMNDEADSVWSVAPGEGPASIHRMLTSNLTLYAHYLFFARELPALLRSDKVLKRRYLKIYRMRMTQIEDTMVPLVALGLLKSVTPEDVVTLLENAWIIGLFALPYAEVTGGGATHAEILRTARRVMHLFKPYMETFAYDALVELAESDLRAAVEALPRRET